MKPLQLSSLRSYAKKKRAIIYDPSQLEKIILGSHHIPQYDIDWRQSKACPHSYIAMLKNIMMITSTSLFINKQDQVLSDEMIFEFHTFGLRPKLWDMELSEKARINKMAVYGIGKKVIDEGIHLTGEYETNYFHWLVEILPKLYLYEQLANEKTIPLLVSDNNHVNMYELLNLICSNRPIIKCKPRMKYKVKKLIYLSNVSTILSLYDRAPDQETTYVPVGLLKNMVADILSKVRKQPIMNCRRLYLKRHSNYRNLLNQEAVEAMLMANGFVSIDPSLLSIEEQITLFQQADCIVGPSGAAMTNILWCQSNTQIIILHSDHPYKKYPYWDALARVANARIQYLSGPRAHVVKGYFQVHDDYNIDIEALQKRILDV